MNQVSMWDHKCRCHTGEVTAEPTNPVSPRLKIVLPMMLKLNLNKCSVMSNEEK